MTILHCMYPITLYIVKDVSIQGSMQIPLDDSDGRAK